MRNYGVGIFKCVYWVIVLIVFFYGQYSKPIVEQLKYIGYQLHTKSQLLILSSKSSCSIGPSCCVISISFNVFKFPVSSFLCLVVNYYISNLTG